MTVDALTTKMLDCQSFQTAHSQAHKNRSAGVSFGRLTERCRTPSWRRRTRTSSCNAARLRKEAKTAAQRADNRYLKGNRGENDNSQFINQIGICENHPVRFRAIWLIHNPFADCATPAISTFHVDKSRKNSTMNRCKPRRVHTSTVKKSAATIILTVDVHHRSFWLKQLTAV